MFFAIINYQSHFTCLVTRIKLEHRLKVLEHILIQGWWSSASLPSWRSNARVMWLVTWISLPFRLISRDSILSRLAAIMGKSRSVEDRRFIKKISDIYLRFQAVLLQKSLSWHEKLCYSFVVYQTSPII